MICSRWDDLRAAFAAGLPQVGDVADLGCGPADDGALLARAGHRVAGIDRSAGMLAYAARVLPGPGQLHEQLHDAGLQVTAMTEEPTSRHWLKFLARAA